MGEIRNETKFLDLDGDGVPDAVETTEVSVEVTDSGGRHVVAVEVVDEIDAEIGIDGVPGTVEVSDAVLVEDVGDADPSA
jgi:hypothetical protein